VNVSGNFFLSYHQFGFFPLSRFFDKIGLRLSSLLAIITEDFFDKINP
jgi:hypothetical protein